MAKIDWGMLIKHTLIGGLVTSAGYGLRVSEKRRPQEQQRQWVVLLAYAIMFAGVVYGLGSGDWLLFKSFIENV